MKISSKVRYKGNEFKIVKKTSVEDLQPIYDIQNDDVTIKNVQEKYLKEIK